MLTGFFVSASQTWNGFHSRAKVSFVFSRFLTHQAITRSRRAAAILALPLPLRFVFVLCEVTSSSSRFPPVMPEVLAVSVCSELQL